MAVVVKHELSNVRMTLILIWWQVLNWMELKFENPPPFLWSLFVQWFLSHHVFIVHVACCEVVSISISVISIISIFIRMISIAMRRKTTTFMDLRRVRMSTTSSDPSTATASTATRPDLRSVIACARSLTAHSYSYSNLAFCWFVVLVAVLLEGGHGFAVQV